MILAETGMSVVAADRDASMVSYARANFAARGLPGSFVCMEAARPAVKCDLLLLDPDRRPLGRRRMDPEAWSPPLSACMRVARRFAGACIELHPAMDGDQVAALAPDAGLEWLGLGTELAALDLRLGSLGRGRGEWQRSVLVLSADGGEARYAAEPGEVRALAAEDLDGITWLADPHPVLLRSGLLGALATAEGMAPIAPMCAYLGGPAPPRSPLLAAWPVLAQSSLDPRRLRRVLDEHDIGPLHIRKRGHPDAAEVLARKFAGRGRRRGHLAVARLERGHRAFLLGEAGPLGTG
jgi:hypothetical protein